MWYAKETITLIITMQRTPITDIRYDFLRQIKQLVVFGR